MLYAFRNQPLKAVYLSYQLLSTLLVRFPLWILFAIPKTWRPRKSWTISRTLHVNLIRKLLNVGIQTGPIIKVPNHLAIQHGDDVNGVWVDAVPHLIAGELKTWAATASVDSIRIPGYWMHKMGSKLKVASPPIPGEKVVYNLHGGGYIRHSAHPSGGLATIPRGYLEFVDSIHRTFSIEYRLSSGHPLVKANPFPTALIDALAGYAYLVNNVGFSPSDIIICGDSAGGNLAHALTLYLVESRNSPDVELAPPGALILVSPWGDLSKSHYESGSSVFTCQTSDYLAMDEGVDYAVKAFLEPHGLAASETNKYISPASKHPSLKIDFDGFPRTFIVGGGAEVLLDQIRCLKSRMVSDLGEGDGVEQDEGKVRYYEASDAIHDYLAFEWHEPERSDTLKEIARWVAAAH
ncbi:hypothetical protein AX17_004491 [Amanita inopinata Kibby_2008]|nr:hypothetical protein AX17_004491 [Amanita inopinata Kibby_2008]